MMKKQPKMDGIDRDKDITSDIPAFLLLQRRSGSRWRGYAGRPGATCRS